jgi:AAA domain
MSLTYEDFLNLFPISPREKAGKGVRVLCPAHNDHNPSLLIKPPTDGFIANFKCFAGCERHAILTSLKLTWADLRNADGKPESSGWYVTDSFVYELETGKEYFAIDRQEQGEKKKFMAKHKVNDNYVFNLEGITPILFKLPELRQAIKNGKTILLPEGEGKVERLRELGFEATTNPFGAGKWKDIYTKEFTEADAVIIPDYDKPGLGFVEQKAMSLYGKAKRIRIIQLTDIEFLQRIIGKEGVDVINWFDAGHTKEELQSLIDNAADWKPPKDKLDSGFKLTQLSDLYQEPDEDIAYLWENLLIKGGLSILAAKPKVGKSTLARNLTYALAKGDPSFLGRNITSTGAVVYLALEEKRSEVKKHFLRMGACENLPIFVHTGSAPEKAIEELRKAIIESKAVLAIVDPLQRLIRLPDLNDYSTVSLALEPLMQIARETGCHILLVHHANKGIAREGGDSILGSTAIFGSVDCALIMKRTEAYRTVESIQRYGEDLPRIVLTFDVLTGLMSSGGTLEDAEIAECKQVIIALLAGHEMTETEIKDGIADHNSGSVSKGIRLLYAEKKINRRGLGKKGEPFVYSIPPENAGDSGYKHIEIPTIPTIFSEPKANEIQLQNAGYENSPVFQKSNGFSVPTILSV